MDQKGKNGVNHESSMLGVAGSQIFGVFMMILWLEKLVSFMIPSRCCGHSY